MKKIEHYVCNICGTMYKDEKTAIACEKYHVRPKKVDVKGIKKNEWIPVTQGARSFYKYPKHIIVQMEDGSVCTYMHVEGR